MVVNIIAAVSLNGAIGRGNALMWHLAGDMKFFRETTSGHPVIMGRKTFESIGRPLPKRTNIVISRGEPVLPEGVLLASSLEQALQLAANACKNGNGNYPDECFVIGGGQIYSEAMAIADNLFITRVFASPDDADTFFPAIEADLWEIISESDTCTDEECGLQYRFEHYKAAK